MIVHLRAFAYLREYLPTDASPRGEVDLQLPEPAALKDLFIALGLDRRLGAQIFLAPPDHAFQVLVNNVAAADFNQPLADGDDIALFPPMAGG